MKQARKMFKQIDCSTWNSGVSTKSASSFPDQTTQFSHRKKSSRRNRRENERNINKQRHQHQKQRKRKHDDARHWMPLACCRRRRARQWNGAAAALANPHGIKFIYVHSVLFKNLTLWWWHGTLNFQPYQYHSHIWITTTCYALDIPYTLDIHISRIYIVTLFFLLSNGVAFLARATIS